MENKKYKIIIKEFDGLNYKKIRVFKSNAFILFSGKLIQDKTNIKAEHLVAGDDNIVNVLFQVIPKFILKFINLKIKTPIYLE